MGYREILESREEETEAVKRRDLEKKSRERGIREKGDVSVEGEIAAERDFFWRLEDLKLVRVRDDRAFFRLDTNLDAVIAPLGKFGNHEEAAIVRNISAGGASIGTQYECCQKERLLLKVGLLSECPEWNLFCRVLRVEKKGISGFVYGCQFIELGDAEREELMQAILELQRRMRGMKV